MRHYINSTNEVLIWNCIKKNSIWTSHGIDNVGRQMTDFSSLMLTPLVQKESICSCSCSSGCYSSRTAGKSRDQCIAVPYSCIFSVSEETSYSHPSVLRIYRRKSNSKSTGYLQLLFLKVHWLDNRLFCEEGAKGNYNFSLPLFQGEL